MKVKIIDLFAGIGGMRLGTEMAAKELGLETETVFSCEHDEKPDRHTRITLEKTKKYTVTLKHSRPMTSQGL